MSPCFSAAVILASFVVGRLIVDVSFMIMRRRAEKRLEAAWMRALRAGR